MSLLASITQDLTDLLQALRNPEHPVGATEAYADELRAMRQEPATAIAKGADTGRTSLADARARRWLGITPAPRTEES